MSWLKEKFGTDKVILASVYLPPLPGSPGFKPGTSMDQMVEQVVEQLEPLREGGVDGALLGNQGDRPFLAGVGHETVAAATRVISDAVRAAPIQFGVTVFWDTAAAIAIARATGACVVRGVFGGAYAGEMGLVQVSSGEIQRYRNSVDASGIRTMFMLKPIWSYTLDPRPVEVMAREAVTVSGADSIALCGPEVGDAPDLGDLEKARQAAGGVPVLLNNGANTSNVGSILKVCDGVVVATSLKKSGKFDRDAVMRFMDLVRSVR
ncbi:MAG: BtpA/SgcQ family protein [Firmicutes bacterium]|nr:BtpA/SgcQ family protein [Bacillota bacterium]